MICFTFQDEQLKKCIEEGWEMFVDEWVEEFTSEQRERTKYSLLLTLSSNSFFFFFFKKKKTKKRKKESSLSQLFLCVSTQNYIQSWRGFVTPDKRVRFAFEMKQNVTKCEYCVNWSCCSCVCLSLSVCERLFGVGKWGVWEWILSALQSCVCGRSRDLIDCVNSYTSLD